MDPPTFITKVDNGNFAPASNPVAETQPIKRKRLAQACDACRKKKVKCSGDKPSCSNCTRLGTTCTYIPSTRKRGPRVGLVESLEKRLQQMEKLLQPLREQRRIIAGDMEDKNKRKKPRLNFKDYETNNSVDPTNPYNEQRFEFINIFSQSTQVKQNQIQREQLSNVGRLNNNNNIPSEGGKEFIFNSSGFCDQKEEYVVNN